MAPKAKAKPKTKAAAKAKALLAPDDKAAEATGGMAPVQEAKALEMVQEVNREHLQKLEGSIQTILSHPLFSNIMHESPLKIDKTAGASEAGMRAPWDPAEHESALTTAGTYVSAGNLFWCNLRVLNSPSVPVSAKSVELQFNYFEATGPEKLREEVVIALEQGVGVDQFQRQQVQGRLRRISPEELDHSLIMYIADLIKEGHGDAKLQQWKQVLLSVSMRVELVDSYEAMFWKGINLRQRYISTYDSLTRSTIQSVLELVKFRDELLPAGSRKEIADHWQMKVADLGSALVDKMDLAFVDTALKVHDRMLCYPAVSKAIMEMDMAFGKASCLNYLRVLELICMKGKEAEQLWMIQSIRDYIFVLKEYTNKDLSTRALQGSPNNRGLLDVFLAKRKMVLWLLEHLQSKNCPCDWIDTLRSLITHAAFREKVGSGSGSRNADQPDKSWLGTEHEVVRLAVDIMKKAIFSAQHDHTLKNILKGSSAPPDIFAKEPYNEMLKGVDDALDAVNHKLKRKDEEVQEAKVHDDDLVAFLPEGVEQCPEDLEQAFQAEIEEAAELVDRFVKWIPECESKAELTQALADTAVAKKQPEGTTALIVLDTKTCGESSSQPHLRLPQFRAPGLRNVVQSFCTARNKEQFDEDEICAVLDGSRMISTSIMTCFVRDDGCHFEGKTRTEFVIHYDEKSMRARKMVSRGLVQVHEGLHVFCQRHVQDSTGAPIIRHPLDQSSWTALKIYGWYHLKRKRNMRREKRKCSLAAALQVIRQKNRNCPVSRCHFTPCL
ncbi:unnamed protein product [Durusdinium trenchii]|uniref:Uncharacterized protein n=1 Tax=Durusdinium trenchii TaxID=1381693 RepID=A0ABP0HD18_9DINO